MKEKLARLITNVLNPFATSFVIIVLLAFHGSVQTGSALKWAAISLALSVVPVLLVVAYLVSRRKIDGFFANPRKQRYGLYAVAAGLGALGCVLLWSLHAPRLLSITFTAGLICIVIFMVINFFWKISLHTAFMAASVAVLIIVYGLAVVWTVVLVPLVAWARTQLKQHTLFQVTAGGLLAVLVVTVIYWGFGAL
jgi:membrane-associated phospholipid phosphatase